MSALLCHDFKTPRTDTSKRLPPSFIAVPVLFYLALLAGAYINISSYLSYRESTRGRDTWKQYQSEQETASAQFESQKAGINKERLKAEKLAQWVEGTRAIQPVSVAIARCVPPEITLSEVSFERAADLPAQIHLNIRINNGTMEEIARIQGSVQKLNYRAYNSQQLKAGDALDYRSMLVWQQL